MTRSPRVVLLRGDDHHNRYLDALLRRDLNVLGVVSEPNGAQRARLRSRSKWRDAVAAEYHRLRRAVLGKDAFRKRFFDEAMRAEGLDEPPRPDLEVSDINDPQTVRFVNKLQPDICVISCVSILSPETISGIGVDIVNIHGGHLPDYRGCHCFFFALADGRFDLIGSTLHFVDDGIDTGRIIEIARPAIRPADDPESLYCKAERLAAHLLVDQLQLLGSGQAIRSTKQPFRGRLCLRRDRKPTHDFRFYLRRRFGLLQLPTVEEGEQWKPSAHDEQREAQ